MKTHPVSPTLSGRFFPRMAKVSVSTAAALILAACGAGQEESASSTASDVILYSACGNLPNYTREINLRRWKRFPLTVFIDLSRAPNAGVGTNRAIYQRGIEYGIKNWSRAGNGLGAVTLVNTPDADIVVKFTSLPLGTVGKANLAFLGEYISKPTSLDLSIEGFGNLSQTILFESTLKSVVTHEMGHLLMGTGHSSSTNSIMFANPLDGVDDPTPLDINTLKEAYCRPL